MLGRVGCGAMGMERLKRMFDTGDGRQAEWAIDRESLSLSRSDRRPIVRNVHVRARGLFSENVPKHNEPLQYPVQSCKFDRCARAASLGCVRPPPSNLARTTTHPLTDHHVTLRRTEKHC
jgi:hypothetical protein